MTTVPVHRVAAGLTLVLACGDSTDGAQIESGAQANRTELNAALPPNPCTLLTEEEAEATLGKELEPPQRRSDCWYLRKAGKDFSDVELVLGFVPRRLRTEGELDRFMAEQVKDLNENMRKAGGKAFTLQRVGEVGAPAYFLDVGLYVFKGEKVLMISADYPDAVAIAAKALPRLE